LNELPAPVLIDEWQRLPEVWDRVRRAVDNGADDGRFILTGSATTPKGVAIHSGAGRIVGFRMRPLSLAERHLETPTVSLGRLLDGNFEINGETSVWLEDYIHEIVASGFPDIRNRPERIRQLRLTSYIDNIVQREFAELGHPVRRPQTLMEWLRAYAAATASTTSYNKIMEAATPGLGDKPSRNTTTVYRDVLSGLWQLDPIEAWTPSKNRIDRLSKGPKHFLADPALAANLLGIDENGLLAGKNDAGEQNLREGTLLGALFEHLVVLSVQVYAQAVEATVSHFRTEQGRQEVDLIVSMPTGKFVAIEVKLAHTVQDSDVRHLLWLKNKCGDAMVDAIVVNTGKYAYRRTDGVAVVPASLLGA
jgi:predicted AAA+ superfamily ATPase